MAKNNKADAPPVLEDPAELTTPPTPLEEPPIVMETATAVVALETFDIVLTREAQVGESRRGIGTLLGTLTLEPGVPREYIADAIRGGLAAYRPV